MEDEGREEEEDPQEESHNVTLPEEEEEEHNRHVNGHTHVNTHAREYTQVHRLTSYSHRSAPSGEVTDGPITSAKTVKQQLVFLRKKQQLSQQPHTAWNRPDPQTLRLEPRQRLRLQQQIQQVQHTCAAEAA